MISTRLPWLCILASVAVFAVAGPAQTRPYDDTPCKEDANDMCGAVRPGTRVILECMQKGFEELQSECKAHIEAIVADKKARQAQRYENFWERCDGDLDRLCAPYKSKRLSAAGCLNQHLEEVSESCLQVLPRRHKYNGPGSVVWDDGTETLESRIALAEKLRPGIGGDQVQYKEALKNAKTPEERKALQDAAFEKAREDQERMRKAREEASVLAELEARADAAARAFSAELKQKREAELAARLAADADAP